MKNIFYTLCTIVALTLVITFPTQTEAAADTKAPVVESVEILTPDVAIGEKLRVQVKVSDDASGTYYVRALFLSPTQAHNTMPIHYVEKDSALSNTYILESEPLTEKFEQGTWKLDLVQTKDNNENIGNYNSNNTAKLKGITFNLGQVTKKAASAADDAFKAQKALKNVAVDKEFTYTFNTNVANSTFTKKNIYVTDATGENVPLMFIVERTSDNKRSTITIVPIDGYERNSTYTLYMKDIIGKDGTKLKQHTKLTFTTKK